MKILYNNETDTKLTEYNLDFENILSFILKEESINNNVEVSLSFVDNFTIQEINQKYRKINKPTDVLSFPLLNNFNIDFTTTVLIGDVIISIDKVFEQCKKYNHSFRREICFLFAHSIYHLLGYDHMTEEEEEEMFYKQDNTLKNLNITR